MGKDNRFSFKQKMVAIFFVSYLREVNGIKKMIKIDHYILNVIYKPQEIDRCGKFRRKRGNAGQML